MSNLSLSSEEKDFFIQVADAAFSNPFGSERLKIDKNIAGIIGSDFYVREEAILKINKQIKACNKKGQLRWKDFNEDDREYVKLAILFDVFHKCIDLFDSLITRQDLTNVNLSVPFGNDIIKELSSQGFSNEESNWYFSLFYQLRRAFYFIKKKITGECNLMRELRCSLWNNIFTKNITLYEKFLWNRMEDFSTILLGETGSGKGAAAYSIGCSGFIPFDEKKECFMENFKTSFVSINLSEYSETLIESELFGHKKGAFTGAVEAHKGLFEITSPYGAVFLDEIGDLSLHHQIKLLKILQDRTFSPVGSHEKIKFHGRVIAATNKSIENLRIEGKFRDDFYYRLCSDSIFMPSLQERIKQNNKELDVLCSNIISKIIGKHNKEAEKKIISEIKRNPGLHYSWPGNVRELEQCIRSIFLKGFYNADINVLNRDGKNSFIRKLKSYELNADELLSGYCKMLYKIHNTYEEVSRITNLDRRTVKKYILSDC